MHVIFGDSGLDVQFVGKCRNSCGVRAHFSSGKFIEQVTENVTQIKAPVETNSTPTQAIQLWTGNKLLTGDVAACATKVEVALNSLGFRDIHKSSYPTETYFYANLYENRAGVHCTRIAGQTFVYGSVAGVNVKTVELLRNNIFEKL